MPLFRPSNIHVSRKVPPRRSRNPEWMGSCRRKQEDECVLSLVQMCLLSLANNMKDIWTKDYTENYLDHYNFRYIIGPFSALPGDLVEELTSLLCTTKQLSRAALHLLLVPQRRRLSLESCRSLVSPALCAQITARCQGLWCLDLSGAQQLPSKVLCDTVQNLTVLRSLSLAGTLCNRNVIQTLVSCCRSLQHLDVSRCHLLSPAALLPLGGGTFFSPSASPSDASSPQASASQSCASSSLAPQSLLALRLQNLLALDIGFGEQEGDAAAVAAYLLLFLPRLEKVAIEYLPQACYLIEHKEFSKVDEFASREGIPSLEDVWKQRLYGQDSFRKKRKSAPTNEESNNEEEDGMFCNYESESDEDTVTDEKPSCSHCPEKDDEGFSGQSQFVLPLKDIKGITCDHLDSLGRLCPDINSMSVNCEEKDRNRIIQDSLLASSLQPWKGQLRRLSVHFPYPVTALLLALRVVGSSLISLTLEGIIINSHSSLLDLIRICPKLRELFINSEFPELSNVQFFDAERDDVDPPHLPNLSSLTFCFSCEDNQTRPLLFMWSLAKVLKCLLDGSPLLEKLSLVSLPCSLNRILLNTLRRVRLNVIRSANSARLTSLPLGRLQHIDLQRTDVQIETVRTLLRHCTKLKFLDLSHCWKIQKKEWSDCKALSKAQVVWE